jgi:hypothetical protein
MRAYALRLCCAALGLPLAACVHFSQSPVDRPLPNDERLIGYWEFVDDKPGGGMVVAADGPTSLSITGYDKQKATHLSAIRTQIGERDFLDIMETDAEGDNTQHRLDLVSYAFRSADVLAVSATDLDSFAKAVTAEELPGKTYHAFNDEQVSSVDIEASTSELRQWIAQHPKAISEKTLDFVRRDPATAPHCD